MTPSCRLGNKQKSSWVIPIITHLRFIKLTTQSHSDGFGIYPSGPRSANGNNYNYQCENSDEAPAALGGSLSTLFRAIKFRRTLNTAIITWEQFREEGENIKSTSANIHVHIHLSDCWSIILILYDLVVGFPPLESQFCCIGSVIIRLWPEIQLPRNLHRNESGAGASPEGGLQTNGVITSLNTTNIWHQRGHIGCGEKSLHIHETQKRRDEGLRVELV